MRIVDKLGDILENMHDSDNSGYHVQSGCDFLLIKRRTAHVIAVNQSLKRSNAVVHHLDDIFDATDSAILKSDILANRTCQPRFYKLQDGTAVWVDFFMTDDHVGAELSRGTLDHAALDRVHEKFAATTRDMERRHAEVSCDAPDAQQAYLDHLATDLQTMSGFDRAMIYQFDSDQNGHVIAEATAAHLQQMFHGLHFPFSDVPAAARRRLMAHHTRQIFDVDAPSEPVVATADSGVDIVFDQSESLSRTISETHQSYLRAMNVRASLVVGIVVHRQLWGLVVLHHSQGPRRLDPSTLTLVQVLVNLAATHLAAQRTALEAEASRARHLQTDQILAQALTATSEQSLYDIIAPMADSIMAHTGSCGFVFRGTGRQFSFGATPTRTTCDVMYQASLSRMQYGQRDWIATSTLERFCGLTAQLTEGFGGTATVKSADGATALQLFRLRRPRQEIWVGDQNPHPLARMEGGSKRVPRGTFQTHRVVITDSAFAWYETALQACRAFHRCFHDADAARQLKTIDVRLGSVADRLRAALRPERPHRLRDPLTNLPNQRAFETYLSARLKGGEGSDIGWFCHVDIDQFRKVNATFGQDVGDIVLTQIAQVIKRTLPRGAHLACLGADAFSIVMPQAYDDVAVRAFCENMQRVIVQPIFANDDLITVTCSIGLDRFDGAHDSVQSVLARSRLALFKAKSAKRGSYSIFSNDMEDAAIARRKLEFDIEAGLEDHAFVPFFQPQIDTATRKVVGLEVLARWDHPERGLLTPNAFLHTAKHMHAMQEIDGALFKQSIATQRGWKMALRRDVALSLNISLERLIDPALVTDLQQLGDAARLITLELLDTIYQDDPAHNFTTVIDALRQTGVGIDVDDFGSDRSSYYALAALRPDHLKIDRHLVEPVARQLEARDLLRSILQIGDHLGIKSVAAGVESEEQVVILRDLGCDRLQGFHLGHPMPAHEMLQRLALEA